MVVTSNHARRCHSQRQVSTFCFFTFCFCQQPPPQRPFAGSGVFGTGGRGCAGRSPSNAGTGGTEVAAEHRNSKRKRGRDDGYGGGGGGGGGNKTGARGKADRRSAQQLLLQDDAGGESEPSEGPSAEGAKKLTRAQKKRIKRKRDAQVMADRHGGGSANGRGGRHGKNQRWRNRARQN